MVMEDGQEVTSIEDSPESMFVSWRWWVPEQGKSVSQRVSVLVLRDGKFL